MSKFSEAMLSNPPRLVVLYQREGGADRFQWGLVGSAPILTLVGYLVRVQAEILADRLFGSDEECDESALVVSWDAANGEFSWFVHPDIPVEPLAGMLELVKAYLVERQVREGMLSQAAAMQTGLVGADGRPILKR